MKFNPFIFVTCIFLIYSCNKKTNDKTQTLLTESASTPDSLSNEDGTYLAVFESMNSKDLISGSLTLFKEGDLFISDIRITNASPSVAHRQNIHIGTKCPSKDMDVNQDGYIDIVESLPAINEVLIPLDADINSQLEGNNIWPVSDRFGQYLWGRTASYGALSADLTLPDENAEDHIVKLPQKQTLNLSGKVIIIQGVNPNIDLPSSVASMGRFTRYQTLPIACGILKKITKMPGYIDNSDEVTGLEVPTGHTVGGSGGGSDGAIFRYGDGSERQ